MGSFKAPVIVAILCLIAGEVIEVGLRGTAALHQTMLLGVILGAFIFVVIWAAMELRQ